MTDNIYDYHIVSQGKVTVASIDDAEEFSLTDVIALSLFDSKFRFYIVDWHLDTYYLFG